MIEPGTPANTATEDEWVAWFNAHYAQVLTGGKLMILREIEREGRPELEFLTKAPFRDWFIEHYVYRGEGENRKRYQWSDLWARSPDRRRYDGLTFDPAPNGAESRYNVWRGWPIACDPGGDCSLFTRHLYDVICQGRKDDYEWLVTWFASIVQNPAHKDGTAVLLRGPQGSGKTIVGQIFGHLFGPHYLLAASPQVLTGRFNAHLAACLLFQLEEAVWGGDHALGGQLKGLITAPSLPVEYKGREIVDMPNYTRVLLTSNASWAIPAALDDRRFAVFDAADSHRNDRPYFGAILDQLEHGGYEGLMSFLEQWPIQPGRAVTPPRTLGLFEQAVRSLEPVAQWYVDLLMGGQLPEMSTRENTVCCEVQALYDAYLAAMSKRKISHALSNTQFGIALRDLCPGILKGQATYGSRPRIYKIPPLRECRQNLMRLWPAINVWPSDLNVWEPEDSPPAPLSKKSGESVNPYDTER